MCNTVCETTACVGLYMLVTREMKSYTHGHALSSLLACSVNACTCVYVLYTVQQMDVV